MVEVFKTNIKNTKESERIILVLLKVLSKVRINFDLNDCDNILRIEAEKIDSDLIQKILSEQGYQSELL